ncbi:cupin, partial [Mesorhizobium sp. M7A.F.Ca.MR.228.00.0.0]
MKIAADHALNDNAATSAEARRSTVLGDRIKAYRTTRRL